ncbi:Adaptin N terminal region family protein [Trichomonas vaginalis G3]|uniref:Adaptin N terminal region family protein n=1 Tax=Trichomonas vaginalis (strain ATCC PRA-98 / G3) TaxID=412133 RepID=A2EJH4_TRIV3|nr:adaptor complex subunit beta family member family [Trichomonas vaginalis G3]EAY07231.1 Adaptin N terminal region family protein [Trichomonas vaginalis G3]KAI5533919.1 adaptor complex subunit beta family member family [Trichomonas vaginalis G3]|eukprot:XP_001319454.1 Adaptin N terminal region family protein [Trichomonas vaginalis G3]
MSNLGSIGSEQIEQEKIQQANAIVIDSAQSQHEQSLEDARTCMSNRDVNIRTNGLKMILAMMSKGHDVSEFAPLVVQEVASPDPVGRQLAYVYLNQYADDALDSIVLAVNTFQRSLTDSDPLMRALAIKVMSSIRSRETIPAVRDAIIQVSGDASPYVKKAAAFAIIKAAGLAEDETETEEYLPSLERFINDENPITFSGAIAAYMALCPDNIELLHPRFRWICQNLPKLDPWAQVFTLRAMTIYARYCFKNPATTDVDESNVAFWDENAQKDQISSDLLLLLSAAKKCFLSINPAVVLAAVSLIFYSAPPSQISCVARPLIRLFYDSQLTAQIALTTALTIATVYPHVFLPHMNHFFVRRSDLTAVKKLKLRILTVLATPENSDQILCELAMYSGSSDLEFATAAVKTMGKVSNNNDVIIPLCLIKLLKLMNHSEGAVLAEVVLVIAHILRKNRKTDDESHALKLLCKKFITVKDPAARSAVLSIVGDMHPIHPEFAPVLLKCIAKHFGEEPSEVRLQALTLAAKIFSTGKSDSKIPMYIIQLGMRDQEFDVRDRARFLDALLTTSSKNISDRVQHLLFPERKAPTWTSNETRFMNYQIGTLSHLFEREVDGYEGLPDWAPEDQLPDESVRYVKGLKPTSYEDDFNRDDGDDENEDGGNDGKKKDDAGDLNDFFGDEEKEYYSEIIEEEEEEVVEEADGEEDQE